MSNNPNIGKVRSPRVSHIGTERGAIMTQAALEIAAKTGVVISASQVVKYLIDNYTQSAIVAMVIKINSSQAGRG